MRKQWSHRCVQVTNAVLAFRIIGKITALRRGILKFNPVVNQKIHMVDLVGHTPKPTELDEAIGRVMATGAFVKGPEVAAFAQELAEFTGEACDSRGNGTDACKLP